MRILIFLIALSNISVGHAKADLLSVSSELNKTLPTLYDSYTKLRATSVEYDHLIYHFVVDISQDEFNRTLPKVKEQILRTVCKDKYPRLVLRDLKKSLVYRYESARGLSLGEFKVTSSHCSK